MKLFRRLRHLGAPGGWSRRLLSTADLDAIGAAVSASEKQHRGEIRIVIEGPLPWRTLWRNDSSRQRAAELFVTLGVSQTREANGILLYVQMLDHQVEILADRGLAGCVDPAVWAALCQLLETAFARGDYRNGLLQAVDRMTALLVTHFPATADNPNELPDRPQLR